MKSLNFYLLKNKILRKVLVLTSCVVVSYLFLFCNKNEENHALIEGIDVMTMAQMHLPDFNLVRERPDSLETEYVFRRKTDPVNVFITVGLYPSMLDAENAANEDFKYMSIRMEEGAHQGISIGDNFWWNALNYSDTLINIVFIRKNALFIMSCSNNYGELQALAKKIDDDIVNEEHYITFSD